MHRPVTPPASASRDVREVARVTQSRAKDIEAYLPPGAPAPLSAFGVELDKMVTESIRQTELPESPAAPETQEGFTRQPVAAGVPVRESVGIPAHPVVAAASGLLGVFNEKRRRDKELVAELQRRSQATRRFSSAPIIKNSIDPKLRAKVDR